MSESLTKLFIHGRHVDATSDETFPTLNPATGAVVSTVQQASVADVDRAVRSATDGFHEWRAMSGAQRGRVLNRAVQLLRLRNDEIAALEVADTGKPISEAIDVDVASGADCIEYFAGAAATIQPRSFMGLHAPRAARRLCGYWRMELPSADRLLEVGASAGLRQLDGVQTGRTHAAYSDGPRRDL